MVGLKQIPLLGSPVVETPEAVIALFRGSDDRVYAIRDVCPHKGGPARCPHATG